MECLVDEIRWLREQIWLTETATREADLCLDEPAGDHKKRGKKSPDTVARGRKFRPDFQPALVIDNCRYFVGRNAKQNDQLTFQLARRGDYWFHANEVPGAHVIAKKAAGEMNETDLVRGASLAAWFSFARESSKVAVDYTDVAHVKRIPGGSPGRVSYTHQKTLLVNPALAGELLNENHEKS